MNGNVYMQSQWLALKVVDLYYTHQYSQEEISQLLQISKPTVSRLLKRGKESGFIQFHIPDCYQKCLALGQELRAKYALSEVIVLPLRFADREKELDPSSVKTMVAMEGARYLQRIITPNDVLGIAWGRTMNLLIDHLNPCQRMDIPFITLHGNIQQCDSSLDVEYLVRRISMAFGGVYHSLETASLCSGERELRRVLQQESVQSVFSLMKRITIAISSVGECYPEQTSPLFSIDYLPPEDLAELKAKDVCSDFMIRFLDKTGKEIDSAIRKRTLSVDLDVFRIIPCKILVAAGKEKAYCVRSVLLGSLTDVLIIDEGLAVRLLELSDQTADYPELRNSTFLGR